MTRFLAILSLFTAVFGFEASANSCPFEQPPYRTDLELPSHAEGYVRTSGGSVFYQYFNEHSGSVVILAPGLPSSLYYRDLAARLYKAGYSVLAFDYPGKMNSDLQDEADHKFLVSQIEELFRTLNLAEHASWHVVGTSMGGVVAAELANKFAKEVKSLTLLNPVGLEQDWTLIQQMARIPLLSHILAPFVMRDQVKEQIADGMICPDNYETLLSEQDQYLASLHSRWNYLNLVTNFGMVDNSPSYRAIAFNGLPILVTSGEPGLDKLAHHVDQLRLILFTARFVAISKTSHIPFIENPEETFSVIEKFIRNPKTAKFLKN